MYGDTPIPISIPDSWDVHVSEIAGFHRPALSPEAIAARQSDGCSTIVAEWEHEVIGVLELRDFSHISMFFVEPEFQCGRRLLTRAVTLCGKARPDLTELTVFAAPRAVEAYRHLGFSADGPERVESGVRFTPMRVKLR